MRQLHRHHQRPTLRHDPYPHGHTHRHPAGDRHAEGHPYSVHYPHPDADAHADGDLDAQWIGFDPIDLSGLRVGTGINVTF